MSPVCTGLLSPVFCSFFAVKQQKASVDCCWNKKHPLCLSPWTSKCQLIRDVTKMNHSAENWQRVQTTIERRRSSLTWLVCTESSIWRSFLIAKKKKKKKKKNSNCQLEKSRPPHCNATNACHNIFLLGICSCLVCLTQRSWAAS